MGKKKSVAVEMEVVSSSSFPPMWKPEARGEMILFHPLNIRAIPMRKGRKKQENYVLDISVVETNSDNFYTGSGKKQVQQEIQVGDTVSIPLSAALVHETDPFRLALFTEEMERPELSPLVVYCLTNNRVIRVVYYETVPIGGGQSVKRLSVEAEKGVREKVIQENQAKKKTAKKP